MGPKRSCITNFFGKCKLGAALGMGVACNYGIHRKGPTEADRKHFFFVKMEKEHGTWGPGKFPYPNGTIAAPVVASGNATQTPPASPGGGSGR